MRILEAESVTKYFGGMAAVSDVGFHVDKGEILGVIGPNGAGKTTLFNLISGALPLSSGEIRFKGRKTSGLKAHQICRLGLARTFQLVKVFGNLSVLQNVMLGSLFGKQVVTSQADAMREAMESLEFVGLAKEINAPAKDLTLGNQKRLEVARALATKPEVLMLDELMAGLNPTEISEAIADMKRLKDQGITIIMIEHVMKVIMSVCDRIIVLHHGKKIADGTPQEVTTSSKVIEVYLGDSEIECSTAG
ncbi:MAG: ABC transporter ATP-binding protein [Bacillota bacterium]|nr:ABC transporter ATP-binding protein [Bacillota bacterium]